MRHHGGEPLVLAHDGNGGALAEGLYKAPRLARLQCLGAVEIDGQTADYGSCALFLGEMREGLDVFFKSLAEICLPQF